MTSPRRRWSFSLRAMLVVVTLAGCCLGWIESQRRYVRGRRQLLDMIYKEGGSCLGNPPPAFRIGRIRRFFGDEYVDPIYLTVSSNREQEVRRLFPESKIERVPDDRFKQPARYSAHVPLPGEVKAPDEDEESDQP